ncbi:hypothetical protein [Sphingobium sp.]|uniref:hypothetical protein n=1 Tax=Sphingobium sp. TaxID=1912891 RepID=UPI0035C71B66
MNSPTLESSLARVAAREKRADGHISQNDAIKSDLLTGKDPVRIAADRGVPLDVVLRIKGWLR